MGSHSWSILCMVAISSSNSFDFLVVVCFLGAFFDQNEEQSEDQPIQWQARQQGQGQGQWQAIQSHS